MTAPLIRLAALYTYPVKGFAPMQLQSAELRCGLGLPHDRRYAISNGQQAIAAHGAWTACPAFVRLTRNRELPRFHLTFEGDPPRLHLRHPHGDVCAAHLDLPQDRRRLNEKLADWFPNGPMGAPQLVEAASGYWDHSDATLSLINTASVAALAHCAGVAVDPMRFRANLYLHGAQPWQELQWLGRRISIGSVELEVMRPIDRCVATSINPASAERDMDVPGLLLRHMGHAYCGVYLRVVRGGRISAGDAVVDRGPAPAALLAGADVPTAPPTAQWPRMALVSKLVDESPGVLSFWLDDPLARSALRARVMPRPGQHLRVHRPEGAWRCYSISAVDADGGPRITVKRQAGDGFAAWMHDNLHTDAAIIVSGPYGGFHLPDVVRRPIVLLSNGIGITPILPMLAALADAPPSAVSLLHTARNANALPLWDEVRTNAARLPQLRLQLFLTQPRPGDLDLCDAQAGRPDWALLASTWASSVADFYLCGTADFVRAARCALLTAQVAAEQIHGEAFVSPGTVCSPPPALLPSQPRQVRFIRSNIVAQWTPEAGTLLDLAEASGLAPAAHCRSGVCGQCQHALISGHISYVNAALAALRDDQVLLCSAVPLSDITVDA